MKGHIPVKGEIWSKAIMLLLRSHLLFVNTLPQLQRGHSQGKLSCTSTLSCPKNTGIKKEESEESPGGEGSWPEMDDKLWPEPGGKAGYSTTGTSSGVPLSASPSRWQRTNAVQPLCSPQPTAAPCPACPLPPCSTLGTIRAECDHLSTCNSVTIQHHQVPLGRGFHVELFLARALGRKKLSIGGTLHYWWDDTPSWWERPLLWERSLYRKSRGQPVFALDVSNPPATLCSLSSAAASWGQHWGRGSSMVGQSRVHGTGLL